ncbi:MAG: extensin family protein [Pseudomonadota bacterium]
MIGWAWMVVAGLATAPIPPPKPVIVAQDASHAVPKPVPKPALNLTEGQNLLTGVAVSDVGSLCQDPRLEGRVLSDITSPNQACGIRDPVRITRVNGVSLSTPATLECRTARRFADWMEGVAAPAVRDELDVEIESAWVMASYACRTRNNKPGARISEHGRGRAIDIGGFILSDGSRITVKQDWGRSDAGQALSRIHAQSCELFQTVLGPEADVHHKNHLHLDTAQRQGKAYCR